MKRMHQLISRGGIAAFFFFSWIIMLLWNSLVAGHLGLGPTLSYLQAAGLWFLVTLLFAWVGIGVGTRRVLGWSSGAGEAGDRIERKIKACVSRWASGKPGDSDEISDRIEAKIKRGLSKWVDIDPDADWEDLGGRIEAKIKQKFRDWTED